jgi:GT2 family glycosyltransferase
MTHLPERPVELVAIINSFNRRALLEQALTSLTTALRNFSVPTAIIVFEAGSSDGTSEFLDAWRQEHPQDNLSILEPDNSLSSFSDGVNAAAASALAQYPRCRWLFLYETDNWLGSAQPVSEAIALLQTHEDLAAVGFTVRRHSGTFCGYGMRFPSASSFALGLNLTARWKLDLPNESKWQTTSGIRWRICDIVFTSPLLIRREAWEQTAGFDAKAFPFSDSDLDWAWRAAKLGWELAVIASDDVVHDNLSYSSAWSADRVVTFHRARLRLLQRHRARRAIFLKPFLFLRHCIETALLARGKSKDAAAQRKLDKRLEMLRTVWRDYSSP